jgi:hypothetical protein
VQGILYNKGERRLAAKAVKGATLTLESVDYVEGGNCLAFGMFSVGDSNTNDVFKEDFEDTTGFFVDEARNTLDTTTTSQTTNSRLGNTL